jgi:phosphoglycerate dehydrogenase-like enzyme
LNLLVGRGYTEAEVTELRQRANLFFLDKLSDDELDAALPQLDCVFCMNWPRRLEQKRISKMTALKFVQTEQAGVDGIPFRELGPRVTVSSNAGAYSREVGEFAIGLLFAAAKRIPKYDSEIKAGSFRRGSTGELGREVVVLEGKSLGILGYGGIGRAAAELGRGVGMKTIAFSRRSIQEGGTEVETGREGLRKVLRESDAIVLALPLNSSTRGIIGAAELGIMKPWAILVNVARAALVVEEDLFNHLSRNPHFVYATDVWYTADGRETYEPRTQLLKLDNFIGTPHVSGPSGSVTGRPRRLAMENMQRFLEGETPRNLVDRSEYLQQESPT